MVDTGWSKLTSRGLGTLKKRLRERREGAQAEASALQSSGRVRGEYLNVFWVKKETKKGKTRNVYLGSCKKMSREEALDRARKRKREGLGIEK